jgi:Bacterial Ig-like domain (group 3)
MGASMPLDLEFNMRLANSMTVLFCALWAAFYLASCTTDPDVDHQLELVLPDSLSQDIGKYSKLAISILDTNGQVIRANAFVGPFLSIPNQGVLKGILIGDSLPTAYLIDIRAFQGDTDRTQFQIKVTPSGTSPIFRIDAKTPSIGLQTLSFQRPAPVLNAGAESRTLQVEWTPAEVSPTLHWFSSDSLTVRVNRNGIIQGLKEGKSVITVSSAGIAGTDSVRDTLTVSVIQDVPISVVDTLPPSPPIYDDVKTSPSPTNQNPRWAWSSGGGGIGLYRFQFGDANFPATAQGTQDTAFTIESPSSGTKYTLFVQERDSAGNWSMASHREIAFDLSKPVVAIDSPQASGTYYTTRPSLILTGSASGPQTINNVSYRVGNAAVIDATFTAENWTTGSIALREGLPLAVTVTATDIAANTAETTLTILLDTTTPGSPTLVTVPEPAVAHLKTTFGWSPGTDLNPSGGMGSGLNGHYRYRLNRGEWKDTMATLLIDLPLTEGNNLFEVQEQDKVLQWSASASRAVYADTSAPTITLTGANPRTSSSLAATLSGTVRDSTGPVSMSVSGQAGGNTLVTVTGTSWTTSALTLVSGANTMVLTAADALGNDRSLSVTVLVNIPAPSIVITQPGDSLTLTNQDSLIVSYTIDGGPIQNQTFRLTTDGVHRLAVSSPPNASGNIGRDTVKVTRDANAPSAPNVSAPTSPTRLNAIWNWTSQGDNAGGAGMRTPPQFQYSLNNGTTWTLTHSTQHQIATEGSHTLVVQEQDLAGNWSTSSTPRTVQVDKTPPTINITSPTRSNYVTNQLIVPIQYRVDNGLVTQANCSLFVTDGRNTCRVGAEDNVGNWGWDSTFVWRRGNVVFVTPAGSGLKNGADWENAMDGIGLVTSLDSRTMANKSYWLGIGDYPELRAAFNATLFGGFLPASYPYNTSGRTPTGSRINIFHTGDTVTTNLDGFAIRFLSGGNSPTLNITDITIIPSTEGDNYSAFFFPYSGNTIVAKNLVVEKTNYTYAVFHVADGSVTLDGGFIQDNFTAYNTIEVFGTFTLNAPFAIVGNLIGNGSEGDYQIRVNNGGRLVIGAGVNLNCTSPTLFVSEGGTCIKQ